MCLIPGDLIKRRSLVVSEEASFRPMILLLLSFIEICGSNGAIGGCVWGSIERVFLAQVAVVRLFVPLLFTAELQETKQQQLLAAQ